MTGNGGGDAGTDDVDGGFVTLTSPNILLAGYQDATVSFYYWFYNGGGDGNPNDNFTVQVSDGSQTVPIFTQTVSQSAWRYSGDISLKNFISLNNHMSLLFTAIDIPPGHLVEAALDVVKIVPGLSDAQTALSPAISFKALPNPSASEFNLQYDWADARHLTLEIRNALGQLMLSQVLESKVGTVICGEHWPKGTYMATLRSDSSQRLPVKLVKQ
jgi:hypothetical protein